MTEQNAHESSPRASRPATPDDARVLTDLANAANRPFLGHDIMQLDEMVTILSMPTLDLARDSRLLYVDDVLVGCAFVAAHEPFDLATAYAVVPPQPDRESIIAWALDTVRSMATSRTGFRPDTQLLFEGLPSNDELMAHQLQQRGATALYSACDMSRNLHEALHPPQWPDGLRVTQLPADDEGALNAIGETNRVAFLDHDGDAAMPVANFVHLVQTSTWVIPSLSLIAWDADQPVGLALNGVDRSLGERVGYVGGLGVLPHARGRGLGRALLLGSFAAMYDAGYTSVMLHVQIGNRTGADRLYRSVGMAPSATSTTTWGLAVRELG